MDGPAGWLGQARIWIQSIILKCSYPQEEIDLIGTIKKKKNTKLMIHECYFLSVLYGNHVLDYWIIYEREDNQENKLIA